MWWVIVSVLIGILILIDEKYKRTNFYLNEHSYLKKFNKIPNQIKIVNIGSSYAYYDLDYNGTGVKGFNAACLPQSFSYDFRILQAYSGQIPKGAVILIPTCLFSFCVDEYEEWRKELFDKYYFILPSNYIKNYSIIRCFLNKYCPLLLNPKAVKFIWHDIDKDSTKCEWQNRDGERAIAKRITAWCKEFRVNSLDECIKSPMLLKKMDNVCAILDSMITYCKEKGWKPVIVLLPVSKQMKEIVGDKTIRDCLLNNIIKMEDQGIPVLDFLSNDKYENLNLYMKADILNTRGRYRLSKEIVDTLKVMNMINENIREDFELYNGDRIPSIGYGTGVIRQYTRNTILFVKDNFKPLLRSIKYLRWDKKIERDLKIVKLLKTSMNNGYRLFDSGRIYGFSEKTIGKATKGHEREQIFLISKISDMDIERKYSPMTVAENLNITLRNLNTDYLDLYLLHYPHGKWEQIYQEMEQEYYRGRVKAIGVCNFNLEQLKRLIAICKVKPMVCQIECHPLYSRRDLRDYCKEQDILVMAHTPSGRMCHEIRDNSILIKLASKYGVSIAQIIMRWHYQNNVIPIVHTLSEEHMVDNYNIMNFTIDDDDMELIEKVDENYILLNSVGIDNPNYIYND